MILFHPPNSRISGAVLLGLSILLIHFNVALADAKKAADYTDEQLLAAGWTAKQIADARASSPEKSPKKKVTGESKPVRDKNSGIDYVSVFENYRSFEDLSDIGWREANDNVGRIGGWRSYARQVQAEQKKESSKGDDK